MRNVGGEEDQDELLVAGPSGSPRIGAAHHGDTDADMVLYQFETSFISMAQSAAGLFGTGMSDSVRDSDGTSISSTAHGRMSLGGSSMMSSFDAFSRASYASNGGNPYPYSHRVPHANHIPSTISELGETSPIKKKPAPNAADGDGDGDDDSILPVTLGALTKALDDQAKGTKADTDPATSASPTRDTANSDLDGTTASVASAVFVPTSAPTASAGAASAEAEKSGEDALMAMFLDKYSDKLVDLLSDKIKNKLAGDK